MSVAQLYLSKVKVQLLEIAAETTQYPSLL